jgi:hypothetical protein
MVALIEGVLTNVMTEKVNHTFFDAAGGFLATYRLVYNCHENGERMDEE